MQIRHRERQRGQPTRGLIIQRLGIAGQDDGRETNLPPQGRGLRVLGTGTGAPGFAAWPAIHLPGRAHNPIVGPKAQRILGKRLDSARIPAPRSVAPFGINRRPFPIQTARGEIHVFAIGEALVARERQRVEAAAQNRGFRKHARDVCLPGQIGLAGRRARVNGVHLENKFQRRIHDGSPCHAADRNPWARAASRGGIAKRRSLSGARRGNRNTGRRPPNPEAPP